MGDLVEVNDKHDIFESGLRGMVVRESVDKQNQEAAIDKESVSDQNKD